MNIRLSIEGTGELLPGVRLSGSEGVSELFRFEIDVVFGLPIQGIIGEVLDKLGIGSLPIDPMAIARTVHGALAAHAGKSATLTFDTGENTRTVRGILAEFTQLDDGKTGTAYRAVLVPRVARLLHRVDSRIFQEVSEREIITSVLHTAGFSDGEFRFALGKERPKREICVQYQESDWAFVCRLLEEEGIHYFFDEDVLVMADGPTAHEAISGGTIAFRGPLGAMAHGEHVSRFAWTERVRPGKVTLRDYDFKKPALALESSKKDDNEAELEIYEHPGDYETPERGADLAVMRLEELRTSARVGSGVADSCRLVPGKTFLLLEHPDDRMNGAYLVTRVEHRGTAPNAEATMLGDGEASYENTFEVVGAELRIRPPRKTPRPVIPGMQTAIVVGPGKEEIHVDAHGRVKVQFHWDRQGKKDDRSSCWLRVMQSLAGAGWGAMFLPRVGHEVVVTFLDGDPDRPLVMGSVYHAANVPPYTLPQHKTRSAIRTKSFGGDGHNEIRFDDATAGEEIYVHAQRDYNEVVEHDHSCVVHGKRRQTVDGDDAEHVRGNHALTVDGCQHVHVRGNHRTIIDGNEPKPGGFRGGGVTVRGKYELDASDNARFQAPNSVRLECGGSSIMVEPGKITFTAGGGATIVLDANALIESVAGSRVFLDANAHTKASTGADVLLDANACATSAAGSQVLLDGNACMTSTGGSAVLLDGNALVSSPGEATMSGATSTVVGEGVAILAGPGGAVSADGGGVTSAGGTVGVSAGTFMVASGTANIN